MDPGKLAELAATVLGPDRVRSAARLDDAIDVAVTLADEAGGGSPASAGVLITGSVVAAGEARRLLGAGPA